MDEKFLSRQDRGVHKGKISECGKIKVKKNIPTGNTTATG